MIAYLEAMGFQCLSLDTARIGYASDSPPPAITWIRALPGTLTAKVAPKSQLTAREYSLPSVSTTSTSNSVSWKSSTPPTYTGPVPTSSPTVRVIEPFSLSLPIKPNPHYPGNLFLVKAHHVVNRVSRDDNELIKCTSASQPREKVLLFSKSALKKHLQSIESEIGGMEGSLRSSRIVTEMEPEGTELTRDDLKPPDQGGKGGDRSPQEVLQIHHPRLEGAQEPPPLVSTSGARDLLRTRPS